MNPCVSASLGGNFKAEKNNMVRIHLLTEIKTSVKPVPKACSSAGGLLLEAMEVSVIKIMTVRIRASRLT